ncbi:lipoate--protein ligase family protein [soil metagenome]
MEQTVNLYPILNASGPEQMARDDVILEYAAKGEASLRFYTWNAPTLSLGYFQKACERGSSALTALPWLRRATGGDAILHGDGDITYSLALPADATWHDGEPWICRFHKLLRTVFDKQGVQSKVVVCGEEATLAPTLCFQHQTVGDLLVNGVKVVGSAQRKSRGALLQHGTIRLRSSMRVPELPGILELTGVTLTLEKIEAGVTTRLLTELGWSLELVNWTDEDLIRAKEIGSERYGSAEWNSKR